MALPRLPLPALEDTCERYLESLRPILGGEEMARSRAAVVRIQAACALRVHPLVTYVTKGDNTYAERVFAGWRRREGSATHAGGPQGPVRPIL